MDRIPLSRTQIVVLAVLAVVVLGTAPMGAVAQSERQAGGTIVVEEGETVDELEAFAGNVIVRGTVTGDVSAFAGNVRIEGDVGGDVEAAAGNVEITGTVDGDVDAGAGTVTIDGTIEGDAEVGADTIRLGEAAAIEGNLRYGGTLEGNTDAVAGEITEDSRIGPGIGPNLQPVTDWVFAAYAFVMNLLLGAALLALFPRFSEAVAQRVATDPVKTGLAGLGVLVGVPILLVAIAITIVGIPISVLGAVAFAFVAWIGVVYGRFAVAAWLLSYAGVRNRWLALVVGLLGGVLLAQIPIVGGLLNLLIVLLGLGALSLGLVAHRRRTRESPVPTQPGGPAAE